jgi:hypothetical protein
VIGGASYTVDSISAAHIVDTNVPYLVVAGKITKLSVSTAFMYVYDYNSCVVKQVSEFPYANRGFFDVVVNKDTLLLTGYNINGANVQQEVVLKASLRDLDLGTQTFLMSPVDSPVSETALLQGQFMNSASTAVVISA